MSCALKSFWLGKLCLEAWSAEFSNRLCNFLTVIETLFYLRQHKSCNHWKRDSFCAQNRGLTLRHLLDRSKLKTNRYQMAVYVAKIPQWGTFKSALCNLEHRDMLAHYSNVLAIVVQRKWHQRPQICARVDNCPATKLWKNLRKLSSIVCMSSVAD